MHMSNAYDWNDIKNRILSLGGTFREEAVHPQIAAYIRELGYEAHPLIVDVSQMDRMDEDLGVCDLAVVVTSTQSETNNGVYIFVFLRDHSYGLINLVPSTISKAPMIRKVTGDMTTALLGVDHPPLTPFDMVEIAGQLLVNTFLKDIQIAYRIPDDQKESFLRMYLPKFLVNIAYYYTGAVDKKTGKPMVNEEIVDMQPAYIREQLRQGVPDIFKPEEKPGPEETPSSDDSSPEEISTEEPSPEETKHPSSPEVSAGEERSS